jgi:hypothetical protein
LLVKVPQNIGPSSFRQSETNAARLDTPSTPNYNLAFLTPAAAANAAGWRQDRGA